MFFGVREKVVGYVYIVSIISLKQCKLNRFVRIFFQKVAHKQTIAITKEQYKEIIEVIKEGFSWNGVSYRANNRIATILVLQANLGLRLGDIMSLKLSDIIKDGDRYRLDIIEAKTGKARTFTVPGEIYRYIQVYALENGLKDRLFSISERAVQKHLKAVGEYLGLEKLGSHSFRKFYATSIYVANNYNIELVRQLLQHGSVKTTQRYIGISETEVEKAIAGHMCLL